MLQLCSVRHHVARLSRQFAVTTTFAQVSSKKQKPASKRKGPAGKRMAAKETFTVAVEGCCHGELDNIYGTLQHLEQKENRKIDLLICCGDFQAVRNMDDLECLACPPKYRRIMTFYKYYSGQKKAPIPTLFIGGNHEATNYLWELHHGGWAAPNIFFLGYSGVVKFGGHRIAGLSGVYVPSHYKLGHFEQPPYNDRSIKSAYHVRQLHAYKLLQLKQDVDIFLSHDWPKNIVEYGDKAQLLQWKPFLKQEINRGEFGSAPGEEILHQLQPHYWFAAHMHTKFPAVVHHPNNKSTRFLALDKCLPGRDFLQVLEFPVKGPLEFQYDVEWLAVMRSTHNLLSLRKTTANLPAFGHARDGASQEDLEYVERVLAERGAAIPHNFTMTAPPHGSPGAGNKGRMPPSVPRNPQTVQLLEMLGLPYNLEPPPNNREVYQPTAARQSAVNPEEIDIDGADEDDVAETEGVVSDSEAGEAASGVAGKQAEEEDEMFRPVKF